MSADIDSDASGIEWLLKIISPQVVSILNYQYPKRWLNPEEFAAEYGISTSSQGKYRMSSSSSKIPFSKIGGKFIRYDRLLIDKWLEDHQVQGGV